MMTKNAITVIDQELIDSVGFALANNVKPTIVEIKSLLEMTKDLIEINAELTKREQNYKNILKVFAEEGNIKYTPFGKVINDLLKGDSDE